MSSSFKTNETTTMEFAIEFAKLIIPAGLVLYAVYLTVNSFLKKDFEKKLLEIKMKNTDVVLPIRLQAYEKLTLLLERISAGNLVTRLGNQSYSAKEFHALLLREIREEFNYNLSQQVYISHDLWQSIKNSIEQYIGLINTSASEMKEDAKGLDLAKRLFEKIQEKEFTAIEQCLIELKAEIQQIF